MPDIVLKNILGQDVTYSGIDTVKLKNTAGDEETFSHGIAVENVPIELDLANGEQQTIYAPEGALVKSAVVSITGGGGGEPVLNMPETVLSFELGELFGVPVTISNTPVDFNYVIEGATYDVVWEGQTVTCTAWKVDYNGVELIGVGNVGALMNAPTTEPFIIGTVDGEMVVIAMQSITTATVSVTLNLKAGGGGETPKVLLKKITYDTAIDSTETVILVTKEELDAIGFDISKKCFFLLQAHGDSLSTLITGQSWLNTLYLSNTKVALKSTPDNIFGTTLYGELKYSKQTNGTAPWGSTISYGAWNELEITTNVFKTVNQEYPYYDEENRDIRYYAGSPYKLRATNAGVYLFTVGYYE